MKSASALVLTRSLFLIFHTPTHPSSQPPLLRLCVPSLSPCTPLSNPYDDLQASALPASLMPKAEGQLASLVRAMAGSSAGAPVSLTLPPCFATPSPPIGPSHAPSFFLAVASPPFFRAFSHSYPSEFSSLPIGLSLDSSPDNLFVLPSLLIGPSSLSPSRVSHHASLFGFALPSIFLSRFRGCSPHLLSSAPCSLFFIRPHVVPSTQQLPTLRLLLLLTRLKSGPFWLSLDFSVCSRRSFSSYSVARR